MGILQIARDHLPRPVLDALMHARGYLLDPLLGLPAHVPGLMIHQRAAGRALAQTVGVRGKRVLEIGGDRHAALARYLLQAGAREVVSVNKMDGFAAFPAVTGLRRIEHDALCLDDVCAAGEFDAVYGVAIIEHLSDFAAILKQIHRAVRPGGVVQLAGNPLWTSAYGHHVYVRCDGISYTFNRKDGGTNPIPPWGHLLHARAAMEDALARAGIPATHIRSICGHVYESPDISRKGYTELMDAARQSPLALERVQEWVFAHPDAETRRALAASAFGPDERYDVSGIRLTFRRA